MGMLTYNGVQIEFDDRLLEHLHIVITQRLQRGERFAMSWKDAESIGDGRSSLWLHPEGDLYFKFNGSRVPAISPEWIKVLTDSATSSRGLIVLNEDGTLARAKGLTKRF